MLDFLQSMLNPGTRNGCREAADNCELEWKHLVEKKEVEGQRSGSKLKIVMRKKAALGLLSKCKNGGRLEANDLTTISAGYVPLLSYHSKLD